MKRHRSPEAVGEGSSRAKLSKESSESTAAGVETGQLSENHQEIDISVFLRSATKAARNDPKPPLSAEYCQQLFRYYLSQANGDTENPRGPDPAPASSPAADLGLADEQHSVQHCDSVGPAPTSNPCEGSSERSNEDDDSELDDGHPHMSDEDGDGSEDLDGAWDYDSDDEFPWYEELDGFANLKPSTDVATNSRRAKRQVGSCKAQLIRRGRMRESFWTNMEAPTQETHDLAFDLFDRYGRLNPEFYEHDVNKGTGAWGKELDHGDLLLFEELKVDTAHRRRGIGMKLVNAILEKTRKKVSERVGFFALVSPGFLWDEISHLEDDPTAMREAGEIAEKGALAFWHAMGFRRVGTSSWLAWTDSPDHPSRQLGIAQDCIHPDDLNADASLSEEMEQTFQKLADPAVEGAECIDELTKVVPEDFEDVQWQTIDQNGNTLLHIVSISCKPEVVGFFIAKVPRLTALRNKKGYTALEALQNQLERLRTRRSNGHSSWVTSDAFEGFSASSIACLAVLEHTAVIDLSGLSLRDIEAVSSATDEQIRRAPSQLNVAGIRKTLRYKYGCTCGQCIGGFLSPRMKLALLCVAEIEHDNMQDFMGATGPDWVTFNADLLAYLPGPVRENLKTNKSMRQGFANMFSHFAKCLQQGRMPSEREVLNFYRLRVSEWPPVTKNYLERGGSVAAVANTIFEKAMEGDEWAGHGAHRDTFREDIDALVACRNDHEFGFVAGVCGYKRVRPRSSRFVDLSGGELDLDIFH